MTAVLVLVMMASTGVLGYRLGRRAGARTPTWRQRMQRRALARQAVTLVALLAAGRLERTARRRLPALPARWR